MSLGSEATGKEDRWCEGRTCDRESEARTKLQTRRTPTGPSSDPGRTRHVAADSPKSALSLRDCSENEPKSSKIHNIRIRAPFLTFFVCTQKIEDGEEVAVEEVEDEQSKMEGMASIALLLDGSISGHFVQLPESVYYQMGQSRLFITTSYLSVKQPTTPTPPSANPKPSSKDIRSSSFPFD
uniref:Uncharacterized protein n=1 Tax=Lactuca sativa TaxID=4236 RepID=A0A9R1XWS1_LACSA|nr:hypothetical protein LSAT_V11C200057850 [Lactuca sativa]